MNRLPRKLGNLIFQNSYVDLVPTPRELFADLRKTPTLTQLKSTDKDFITIFNENFCFHDAEVLSHNLDLKQATLELVLNYIVRWERVDNKIRLQWRKLQLVCEGIFWIEISRSDPELGFPHEMRRRIDLKELQNTRSEVLARLTEEARSDLMGSDLNAITVARFGEGSSFLTGYFVEFDWITKPLPETVTFDKIWCTKLRMEFLSETSSDREQPWSYERGRL